MASQIPAPKERPVVWVGSSLKDLRQFPAPVQRAMGFAIRAAQDGGMHADAKPWKGERSVYEIVEDHDSDTFRAVYTVCFEDVVYVLHAFQKKSPTGIKTSEPDKRLVKSRLAAAKVDYEETRRKKRD